MFRSILVPLDGSKLAECALPYAEELAKCCNTEQVVLVSVTERIQGYRPVNDPSQPLGHLEQRLAEVPGDKPVAVICKTGHRAGLGASIFLRAGYKEVYNVLGSVKAWVAAGFPVTID